jgi:hypothetical protein
MAISIRLAIYKKCTKQIKIIYDKSNNKQIK